MQEAQVTAGNVWVLNEEQEFSSTPIGVILRQTPEAGSEQPPGSTVTVVVSRGPEFTAIPDVRGIPESSARQRLENLGFVVDTVQEESDDFAEGTVIRTEPVGQAPTGSTVVMVISSGAASTTDDRQRTATTFHSL